MKGFIEITRDAFAGDGKPVVTVKQLINVNSIVCVVQNVNRCDGAVTGCTICLEGGDNITTSGNADVYEEVKRAIDKALSDTP